MPNSAPPSLRRRLVTRFRAWQEPCWDFRPLQEHPAAFILYVVVLLPLIALTAFAAAWFVGVDVAIHSVPLVAATIIVTAVLSPIVFKADNLTTVDTVGAIPLALLLSGEMSGAIIAIVISMFVYALKTPLPSHHTIMINSIGCGVLTFSLTGFTMHVAAGGADPLDPRWVMAAVLACVVHFSSAFLSCHIPLALGEYQSWREGVETWRSTIKTELTTIASIAILAGAAMSTGVWWFALFAATPFIAAWEAYSRTNQFVEARNEADRDALTGLYNRRALENRLSRLVTELSVGARPGPSDGVWVMLCDLDNFKRLNDVHGHAAGDAALKVAADVLVGSSRGNDLCARYGGEELVIIISRASFDVAENVAERVRSVGESRLAGLGTSFSIGMYELKPGDSAQHALHQADMAMYVSKSQGKNRTTFWSESLADEGSSYNGERLAA